MKAIWITVLVLALGIECSARTVKNLSDPQIEDTIQSVLASRHKDEGRTWWQDLGPRAPIVIVRMYTESRHVYLKTRLVGALGNYDTPDVASFLRETALSTTNGTLRAAAIRALGRSQGMKEEAFLTRALKSHNPHTRLAAAEALKGTGDRRAVAMVDTYCKQEKATWVVARLKRGD